MPDQTDQSIVQKAIAGDTHAFRILVEKHQSFVFRVAHRFVGHIGEAEDICQETFIRLWKNLHRYDPHMRLTTWLYRIAANLCLDFLKSRQHRANKNAQDLSDSQGKVSELTTDQSLIDDEARAVVQALAEQLSPKQKAVFILRDLEELDMMEISKILSMDRGQVKSNLYYARKRISELIDTYYQIKKEIRP